MPDAPSSLTTSLQKPEPARKTLDESIESYASGDVLGQAVPILIGTGWVTGTIICDTVGLYSKKQKTGKK